MYTNSRARTRVVFCIVTADDGHSYTNLFLYESCVHIKKVNKLNWRKSIIRQYFYSMVQCLYFVCTRADMLINSYKTYGPEDHVHRSTDVRPVQWMTVLAGSSGEKIQFRVLNVRKNQWIWITQCFDEKNIHFKCKHIMFVIKSFKIVAMGISSRG